MPTHFHPIAFLTYQDPDFSPSCPTKAATIGHEFCHETTYGIPGSKGGHTRKGREVGKLRVWVVREASQLSDFVETSRRKAAPRLVDTFYCETTYRLPGSMGRCTGEDGESGKRAETTYRLPGSRGRCNSKDEESGGLRACVVRVNSKSFPLVERFPGVYCPPTTLARPKARIPQPNVTLRLAWPTNFTARRRIAIRRARVESWEESCAWIVWGSFGFGAANSFVPASRSFKLHSSMLNSFPCDVGKQLIKFRWKTSNRIPTSKGTPTTSADDRATIRRSPVCGSSLLPEAQAQDRRCARKPPSVEGDVGLDNGVLWLTRCSIQGTLTERRRLFKGERPSGLLFFFWANRTHHGRLDSPLKRFEREVTQVRGTNGRMTPPVCGSDEYLRGGEIMIL
ncbi:hypothetical protein EDD18DRAFT_1100839 [Armillaria luteobubalina]|uniref:Uncharacterized protein n=1 Tax=Armillaria luteobubalina TaxID=153913 RepID=A0AA39QHH1_9AGAR|nr:hypothetical protein EDD18DRAFT_1100839 [Armillaria luteobubalina]